MAQTYRPDNVPASALACDTGAGRPQKALPPEVTPAPVIAPEDFRQRADQMTATTAQPASPTDSQASAAVCVLTLREIVLADAVGLLDLHGLQLSIVSDDAPIPGSFWGEPEAGVIASTVYARSDTPVHSLLHEACHLIVLPPTQRAAIHTDATDSDAEEDAACYLQIVLADALPNVGRARLMSDMDTWGYTFRLGSARAWFENDADDAREWLAARKLLPL